MINEESARLYCREDISLIENYEQAINDKTQTWHCHHRDEVKILPSGMVARRTRKELKENGRYYNCPANELIFLTKSEHTKLHNKGVTWMYGKHHTEETKRKMSESHKGIPPYNKGKISSDFSKKFKEHYGFTSYENPKLYHREQMWYFNHNHTCRWEKEA